MTAGGLAVHAKDREMQSAKPDSRCFVKQIRAILGARARSRLEDPSLTCAAVLIPLVVKDGEWHVVVTMRTEQVEHHKGQISFPGGACDPEDGDLQVTALRETFEEIGVPPDRVEVLGALDDHTTVTNFVVTPFVGVIRESPSYRLNEKEVEAAIEVPLSFLRDPAHLRTEQRRHGGRVYDVLVWKYSSASHGTVTIWGATARMLRSFLDLLESAGLLDLPTAHRWR